MASNTSALDVNEIASVTSRPESVIGMPSSRRPM